MAPGLVPSPRHLGGHRLLLTSLTGSERRGNTSHGPRPHAVAPSSRRTSSPAHIPDWELEEGKLCPWHPASCPLPRHLGGRRLLLTSLTGSERRGDTFHGTRPRAVAWSSRRTLSPARIPDWEREEGKLRRGRLASSRRPVAMTYSFHQMLLVEEIAVSAWHLLQRPTQ